MMLALQAHYDEALVTLERAAEVYRVQADLESEVRTLAQLGRIHRWRGSSQEGLTRLLPLRERLPKQTASRGAAAFYIALAYLYKGVGQYSEQVAAAEHAAQLAQAIGDAALLTTALERRASALLTLGRLEETCRELTTEVIPASEAAGNLWTWITALDNLAGAYALLGAYQQARLTLDQALALNERLGDPAEMAYLLSMRGLTAFALGDWHQARPAFERAATVVGATGQFWYASYPAYGLGVLNLAEGREEAAAHALSQALRLAQQHQDQQALCWVQATLAEWDLLAGRAEAARDRLAPLLDAPGLLVSYSREALALLAWAYLEVGEADQAHTLLTQVLSTARQARMKPTLVQALRVQALLVSKQERWQEAEQALQEALTLCRAMAAPYAEAKTLSTAGLVAQHQREWARARERFEAALTLLEHLGERLYSGYIKQVLSREEARHDSPG